MSEIVVYKGLRNVSLGVMQEHHVQPFTVWANQRGIEGTMLRPPYTPSSGLAWLQGFDKRANEDIFALLIHVLSGGQESYRYIGHTGLHDIRWPDGFGTSGTIMADPAARAQKGLGAEAKLLLLNHAFCVRGLRKVISAVKAFNGPSLGHLLKCGYRVVGRYANHHFHKDTYVDGLVLEVFRDDWEPIWDAYQSRGTLPRLTDEQRAYVQQIVNS